MKKLLIISPHFPPVNAADMHRVRQSLPYFKQFGWEPTVLTVDPIHVEMAKDVLLEQSMPDGMAIHKVSAYSTRYTRKLGLGNLGLRAFYQLYKKGNELLKSGDFDLVYFSTTVFACMPLGRLWKQKFKVPFVIDMQDPWRNDYYLSVPKNQQPPKFWFAHRLNSVLEGFTIPKVDGVIAVTEGYIKMLQQRYASIECVPTKVLTFGAAVKDFELLSEMTIRPSITFDKKKINLVYVGRGGHDMEQSLSLLFEAFQKGMAKYDKFKQCHFWFIGTSYAPNGEGKKTIETIADNFGVRDYVTEITDRKPYFEVLSLLQKSDIIVIPGSDDTNYTASKLYPNILAKRPLLCVFHSNSSVVEVVKDLNAGEVVLFDKKNALENCCEALIRLIDAIPFQPKTKWEQFEPFTANHRTKAQCDFFNQVILKS